MALEQDVNNRVRPFERPKTRDDLIVTADTRPWRWASAANRRRRDCARAQRRIGFHGVFVNVAVSDVERRSRLLFRPGQPHGLQCDVQFG